jgi:hypothetical protein
VVAPVSRRFLTADQRGYGVAHWRLKDRLRPFVAAGLIPCAYCGERIVGEWDLGHSDNRRSWIGPTHAVCNRREAGHKTARLRRQRRTITSQEW